MDVFRTLMRTRRIPMSQDHVGALNLVEIEFHFDKKVIEALKNLFQNFGTEQVRRADEQVEPGMEAADLRIREERFNKRLAMDRAKLLARLLHEIARVQKFKVEQLELFEGGYSPQGWLNVELEQAAVRGYALDLAAGRRVVPVGLVNLNADNHRARNIEPPAEPPPE